MIITKLSGGLGNQMFQYATARALATRHGTETGLDMSWFQTTNNQDSTRFFELDCFAFKKNFVDSDSLFLVPRGYGKRGKLKLRVQNILKKEYMLYREQLYSFNKDIMTAPDNVLLEGHWTTEKYFANSRDVILSDFSWSKRPNSKNSELLNTIRKSGQAVGLHIRRGDYVANKDTKEYHGVLGMDYYKQADKILKKSVNTPKYFVFSDDISWTKKNLKLSTETVFVDVNTSGSDDMRLMHECQHFIIANSTFSWWGAWLGRNKNKIVIAPKQWAQTKRIDTSDVVPSEWVRI